MTNQFSQEYIDYILSDEAKALQKKWEPQVRDAVANVLSTPYILSVQLDNICEQTVLQDEDGQFSGTFDDIDELGEWVCRTTYVAWLPALYDLLQIIEGAGYEWKLETLVRRDVVGLCYYAYIQNYETETYFDTIEHEVMLAAAKLAVKALK